MGIKRIVDTSFWTDGKVEEFSPEDRYFMLYLLTNPQTKQLGIYEFSVKRAAYELGYSMDVVNVLLERFETKYKLIVYSKETNEIAIKNFLRHSIIKGGKPVEDCITAELAKVKNRKLISIVFHHISSRDDLNATVKKIIADYEIEDENDNENDNDNDVSLQRYGDVSSKASKKVVKHKYGEYSNVLLTDDELSKLKSEYSDWNERIERLSAYIASKGTKYKSHYATIRNWARKEGVVSGGQTSGNSSKVRVGNYI
jgi:hypothetical protein